VKTSLLARLRSKLAEVLWMSRLGSVLGRRHAEYLRNMLELFDRGELDEALRRAIPLGGDGDGTARLGVTMPRRRDNLNLTFGARRAGSVIPVADMAMDMLRQRYRDAAARLEREGRIDEAAFAFAELLNDVDAAIALLERHGHYAIAARLAEPRDLNAGLVVRLWFLAGEQSARSMSHVRAGRGPLRSFSSSAATMPAVPRCVCCGPITSQTPVTSSPPSKRRGR